ncbi:filamentous hemagglutinin N-terminal domain-containing protein [bacterium]|nr:filamentous hemagglutinin N-terminal domain-containing protein [bacterium]
MLKQRVEACVRRQVFRFCGLILAMAICLPWPALALPQGGNVAAGSATIDAQANQLNIHQQSNRAVIDWRAFDVRSYEAVRFHQPGRDSLTVNRVNSARGSFIDGQLTANGRLVILNQNGVMFGPNARVDASGIVASTSRVTTQEAMNGGHYTAGNNPNARVVNQGRITARNAGLVGLVAPQVENSGVIEAQLGRVQLASGNKFTLDMAGDGLLNVAMEGNAVKQLVKNQGTIAADGGSIALTAAQARNQVDRLILNQGVVQANRVQRRGGEIILSAGGAGGRIVQSGKVRTRGATLQDKGGTIRVLAEDIELSSGSSLDATGPAGGGVIHVGGGKQGRGEPFNAKKLTVQAGTRADASATYNGHGGEVIFWSDGYTSYEGHAAARGGAEAGNGGFIEVSGKNHLDFNGTADTSAPHGQTGDLLLDPGDIIVCQYGASSDASCNPSGAPDLVAAANVYDSASNATSYVNIGDAATAGTLVNLLNASNVTIQTNASGAGNGDITIADAISWTGATRLTLNAHRDVVVNAPISGTGQTYTVGRDVVLNASISDAGANSTLIIQPKNTTGNMSIGSTTASFNISATDRANIAAGWNTVQLGSTSFLGTIDVDGWSYTGALNLYTGNGTININGTIGTGSGNMTINTRNLTVAGALTGTGTLTFQPDATGVTIGVGNGATGVFNLDTTELGFITNGWGSIVIGRTNGTGAVDLRAATWNDNTTIRTGNAGLTVNGAQDALTNNLTLSSRTINVLASLTGSGTLSLTPDTNSTVGIGNGSAGGYNLTDAELGLITNGWGSISLGLAGNTGAMDIQAYTWNDNVIFRSGTGAINLNGVQNFQGNNATFSGRLMNFNQDLNGTGTLAIGPDANVAMGIGDGQPGTLQLTNAKLDRIKAGWATVVFGSTSTLDSLMTVGAYTWNYNTDFRVDDNNVVIAGAQNAGAYNMTLRADREIQINAALNGTGNLTLSSSNVSNNTIIGSAAVAGTTTVSNASLDNIQPGFANIYIGTTGDTGTKTFNAVTWNTHLTIRSSTGVVTVSGAQNTGTYNLTMELGSNPAINAALTGSGILYFKPLATNTTTGLAGGAGTMGLSVAELDRITDGWQEIMFGRADSTVAMAINAYSNWRDPVHFYTNTGVITVAGAQNFNGNNATFETNSNMAINANLSGTGVLTIMQAATNVAMGLAGGAGAVAIDATELGRIQNGWSGIVFGNDASASLLTLNSFTTWADDVTFRSGTGGITVAGAQNFNGNDATFLADGAFSLNANLTSAGGDLTMRPVSNNVTVGLAGGAGTFNVDAIELARIQSGWGSLTFGNAASTVSLEIAGYTGWNAPVSFVSGSGGINVTGAQNFNANNATFQTTGDVTIGANLSGTGTLSFYPGSITTSVGIAGGSGIMNFSTSELDAIQDGFSEIIFGRSDSTAAIQIGAYSNWKDPVRFVRAAADVSNRIVLLGNQAAVALSNAAFRFTGPVLLNAGITLATDGGNITFNSLVDGAQALVLNAKTGQVTFDDDVGAGTALSSLSVTSDIVSDSGDIRTTGDINLVPYTAGSTIGLAGGAGSWQLSAGTLGRLYSGTRVSIGSLSSGDVTTGGAISIPSRLLLLSGGTVRLNGSLATTGNGNSLVIAASIFDNQAGAGSLNPGAGRYLIYSADPADDTRGESSGFVKRYNRTYGGYPPGSVTETGNVFLYSIAPTITVSASSVSREYGDANPGFTPSYSGFIDGDTAATALTGSASFSTAATNSTGIGTAGINASVNTLVSDMGYSIVSANTGVLTITPATLTVTAQNKTKEYGDANPALTLGFSGFKNSDTSALFTGYTLSSLADATTGVGTEAITLTGGSAGSNYTIVRNDGVLTITPAVLTVTAQNKTKVYGDANPVLTLGFSGFKNSDGVGLFTGYSLSTAANVGTGAGTAAISLTGGSAGGNYTIVRQNGTLTIARAGLNVIADNATRAQGEPNPAFTYTLSGLRNGDLPSVVSGVAMGANAGIHAAPGTYVITPSGGTGGANYTLYYVNGALVVTGVASPPSVPPVNVPAPVLNGLTQPAVLTHLFDMYQDNDGGNAELWWQNPVGPATKPSAMEFHPTIRPLPGYMVEGLLYVAPEVRHYFSVNDKELPVPERRRRVITG